MKTDKKIVVIGGGTGVFTAITGLKKYFNDLTAIVTMADDGGSTGILREEFGILPPGDVRRALIALSGSDKKILSELFNYRFKEGSGLTGHSFGNLLITALERVTGSFDKAILEAGKLLSVRGQVLPVTLERPLLFAELENGKVIKGEANIDIPKHDGLLKIRKIWLKPNVSATLAVKKAILSANGIIIGPGDLYTSIIPNLLVGGVKEALQKAKGKKIYFVNLMTKFGETTGFRASNFLEAIEKYLGKNVLDYVVVNKARPSPNRFRPYAAEKAEFVAPDLQGSGKPVVIISELLKKSGFLRHDPEKIAKIVKSLI